MGSLLGWNGPVRDREAGGWVPKEIVVQQLTATEPRKYQKQIMGIDVKPV